MKTFKDIKTNVQLWLGFSVFLVIIMALTYVSWQQTAKMTRQSTSFYNYPLTLRRASEQFESGVLTMRIGFKNMLLATNEKKWNTANAEYFVSKDKALQQLEILHERFLGKKADIDSLRIYFLRWSLMLQEYFEKSTKTELDIELIEQLNDSEFVHERNLMFDKMHEIEIFTTSKAEQFYFESQNLDKQLNKELFSFVIVSIIFLLVLAGFISRLIRNPLNELKEAAILFREGKMSTRSSYVSQNEFGQLSDAFNEMAEKIETEFILNEHAAELAGIMLKEDDARKFCQDLLDNLIKHTKSQMGAVYLLNEEKNLFVNFESIGMEAEGCRAFSATNKEGEFGIALASGQVSHIKNIPDDSRFIFNTVSGSFIPKEIITVPIISGDEVISIISLFSLQQYSLISLRLIENIFSTLTSRMIGILNYKTIIEFSHKLEQQNEELEMQKKEIEKMANEQLLQNKELEQQKYQLMEASRLKTNFLSNMSHELRTPLNSVIALSGVLNRRLRKQIHEEEYSYLGVIERNGKHLLNLINDILDLSRIESGKVEVEKNSFDAQQLVEEVVSMVKPQADVKSIGLYVKAPAEAIMVESDYKKCVHIIQNIIANAVKFTDKGQVEVSVESKSNAAIISISDTGIGMSQADIPYIFDEFRQADGSNSRKYGGTGLGLSIAKKYTELLGGKIEVISEPGKGSIFTLTLPLKARYDENEVISIVPELLPDPSETLLKVKSEGKTILLVEDTEPMVIQMRDILEEGGYTVDVAENGFKAIEKLEQNIPDAIILDLMLPGMDGFEVLRKIRERKQTAELPVLILTAKILNKEELEVIKINHAHQLIQKGKVTKESLIEAIALLMLTKKEREAGVKMEIKPVKISGKPNILAVEDNADNMLAMKALIGDSCTFIEAVNGNEAIEKAKKYIPDLIFMDIAMPGKNGFETLIEIRKTDETKHIPVIVVTSSAMRGDKTYFLEFGFNGYVSKPINPKLLQEEMSRWIIIEE